MSTTSAASEEAVAPRAPIATPTVARGQRGGVVEAVADHHGDRALPLGAHARDLARGCLLGAHLVEPQHFPDLSGRFGPVPGEHHQALDTGGAQPPQGPARVDPQRVLQQDGTDRVAVGLDPHQRAAIQPGPADAPRAPTPRRVPRPVYPPAPGRRRRRR